MPRNLGVDISAGDKDVGGCPAYFPSCPSSLRRDAKVDTVDFQTLSRMVGRIDSTEMQHFIQEPWRSNSSNSVEARGSAWFVRLPWEDPRSPVRYMVTCFHCVRGALPKGIHVITASTGSSRIPVKVIAALPAIDGALLRLDLHGVPDASFVAWEFGDDRSLRMGDKMNVYGYPGGQGNLKVVSSTLNGRQDGGLQVDGAVNEGHSGGPLVDGNGRVVGWIYGGVPESNNMCYAKPISLLLAVLHDVSVHALRVRGKPNPETKVYRPRSLGFSWCASNPTFWEANGCDGAQGKGVIVSRVSPLSPLAGIVHEGDAVCGIEFCGVTANGSVDPRARYTFHIDNDGSCEIPWAPDERYSLAQLYEYVSTDQMCRVTFWDCTNMDLCRVTAAPGDYTANGTQQFYPPYDRPEYETFGGVVVMPINADVMAVVGGDVSKLFPDEAEQAALAVLQVLPGSAFTAGENAAIRDGDIVAEVNMVPVRTVREYREALANPVQGKYWLIKTISGRAQVVDIDKVLQDERELASAYGYKPTMFARLTRQDDAQLDMLEQDHA